ncbi:MAG: hypothetical protein CSA68_04620 [Rhodobacterales bacterium]|nr:MAG: hypothetical protein CSA68_04620 [Rhodobacterales bacterium]
METEPIDQMIQYAIAALFEGEGGWRTVPHQMVQRWPDVEGLELCFALVAAANAIEENFNMDSPASLRVIQAYRLAALISADLYGMVATGKFGSKAGDLLKYWQEYDPYFLVQS